MHAQTNDRLRLLPYGSKPHPAVIGGRRSPTLTGLELRRIVAEMLG
jgi:hypothetical protein